MITVTVPSAYKTNSPLLTFMRILKFEAGTLRAYHNPPKLALQLTPRHQEIYLHGRRPWEGTEI